MTKKIDPDYRSINKPLRNPKAKIKVATAKDSADYKAGFEDEMAGKGRFLPNKRRQQGADEARQRKTASPMKKISPAALAKFPAKPVSKKMATMPKKRK